MVIGDLASSILIISRYEADTARDIEHIRTLCERLSVIPAKKKEKK